jgi:uncharacterized protein YceK
MRNTFLIILLTLCLSGCSTVEKYNLNPQNWFGNSAEPAEPSE